MDADELAKLGITEFTDLDPTELHLVRAGANGFPALLAKAREEVGAALDEIGDLTKAYWAGFCGEERCVVCKDRFGPMHEALVAKAKLKAKARNKLPDSAFALPATREYPIHDENHARAALSMLHNASPDDQERIKAAVRRKYKDIDQAAKAGKPQTAQESHPIPRASGSQAQSHELHPGTGPKVHDTARDGSSGASAPAMTNEGPTQSQEGHGDTAPDKNLPVGEAQSQGKENAAKTAVVGEGGGTTDPEGADDDKLKAEAASQGKENAAKGLAPMSAAAASQPGSAAWEQHDATLADRASQFISMGDDLIRQLGTRERAEGGQTTKAINEAVQACRDLTQTATKELEEMTTDELIKLLDERDAAARRASKDKAAAKAKKADKKAKAKADADEMKDMAAKAAADPALAVLAATDPKAFRKAAKGAMALAQVQKGIATLTTELDGIKEVLTKVAATPMPMPVLNAAGIAAAGGVAALRGQQSAAGSDPFQALKERTKAAEDGSIYDLSKAAREESTARLVAFERNRAAGLSNAEAMAKAKAL